jgi:hypothetical protein
VNARHVVMATHLPLGQGLVRAFAGGIARGAVIQVIMSAFPTRPPKFPRTLETSSSG